MIIPEMNITAWLSISATVNIDTEEPQRTGRGESVYASSQTVSYASEFTEQHVALTHRLNRPCLRERQLDFPLGVARIVASKSRSGHDGGLWLEGVQSLSSGVHGRFYVCNRYARAL